MSDTFRDIESRTPTPARSESRTGLRNLLQQLISAVRKSEVEGRPIFVGGHRERRLLDQYETAIKAEVTRLAMEGLRPWAVHHDHCGYRLEGTGLKVRVALPRTWMGGDCTCGLTAALAAQTVA